MHKQWLGHKDTSIRSCSLCSCFLAAPEAAGGTGLSPLKPPAQAAAASAAAGAAAQRAVAASASKSRRSERTATRSDRKAAVRCQNRVEHIKQKSWDCITSAGAPRGVSASLPEREQRLVLLRPGPFPTPDAGKASLHAGPTAGNLGRRAHQCLSNHSHVPGEEQPNNLSIFRPSRGDGDHT